MIPKAASRFYDQFVGGRTDIYMKRNALQTPPRRNYRHFVIPCEDHLSPELSLNQEYLKTCALPQKLIAVRTLLSRLAS